MAKSLDINSSSYAGELALPYIAPAILAADSIANGYITVHENVKFKAVLKKLSNSADIIDAYGCDFSANAGDLDLDEAILTPTELKVNQEICKGDFRSDWEAMQTGRTLMGDRLPPNFEAFLLQFLAGKVSESVEKNMWGGNFSQNADGTDWAGNFDGIMHHVNDARVAGTIGYTKQLSNTAGANYGISTANVLDTLEDIVTNAPTAVQNSLSSKLFISRSTLFKLQRALGGTVTTTTTGAAAAPTDGNILTGGVPTQFLGYEIVVPAGLPPEVAIFGQIENLHFGCNLATDQIEANVVDMTLTDASDNVRVAMRFSGGTQIGFVGDVSAAYIY